MGFLINVRISCHTSCLYRLIPVFRDYFRLLSEISHSSYNLPGRSTNKHCVAENPEASLRSLRMPKHYTANIAPRSERWWNKIPYLHVTGPHHSMYTISERQGRSTTQSGSPTWHNYSLEKDNYRKPWMKEIPTSPIFQILNLHGIFVDFGCLVVMIYTKLKISGIVTLNLSVSYRYGTHQCHDLRNPSVWLLLWQICGMINTLWRWFWLWYWVKNGIDFR